MVAVFIHGCFWHGCKRHFKLPDSNEEFWQAKIARNVKRDREVMATLRRDGWRVIRAWEHEMNLGPTERKKKDGPPGKD